MPCLTCQDFERHKYGITIATLGLSVAAGCPYCDVIQQCLFGMFHPEDISNFSLLRFLGREEFNQQVEVNLRHNYRPKDPRFGLVREGNTEDIAIINPAGREAPGDWAQLCWPVPADPKSAESLAFVSECLQQCITEHDEGYCGESPSERIYPARVVDLTIKPIKISNYHEALGPYIALSHCWGGDVPFKLTFESGNHFQNIDSEELPNTFRDAIYLTKYLGYSYIWIDSLCIFQDSRRDWEKESSKMGNIYRNAVLTIAAASSKSSKISFLAPQPRPEPPTLDVVFTDRTQKSYDLKAVRQLEDHEPHWPSSGPLHRRAWCYQEYLLSRRIITYNNDEMVFRCRLGSTCQCQQRLCAPPNEIRMLYDPASFDKTDLLASWFEIVLNFSGREITFDSDRLAALAGIASTLQKATGWTYIAGIWSTVALPCLAWLNVRPLSMHFDEPKMDIAPTFSWASAPGQVFYNSPVSMRPSDQITIHTYVIRVCFNAIDRNPFDRVAPGAFIELQGPVLEVGMIFDEYTSTFWALYDDCKWKYHPDSPLSFATLDNKLVAARSKSMGSVDQLCRCSIWILFLASTFDKGSHLDAIVLRKLQTNSDDFERIGLLRDFQTSLYCKGEWREADEILSVWIKQAKKTRLRIF